MKQKITTPESNNVEEIIQKVEQIKSYEWIPIFGVYLYFFRINFAKINYVKAIRVALTKYIKYYQLTFLVLGLPFLIWTSILIKQTGWGFKLPIIGLLVLFSLQFCSPLLIKKLYLKGLMPLKKNFDNKDLPKS